MVNKAGGLNIMSNQSENKKYESEIIVEEKKPYHDLLIKKVVKLCIDHDMVIYGDYIVRYMCGLEINYGKSDLNILSNEVNIDGMEKILQEEGLRFKVMTGTTKHFDKIGRAHV